MTSPVADSVRMDVGQGAEQLIHVQLDIRHRDRLKYKKLHFNTVNWNTFWPFDSQQSSKTTKLLNKKGEKNFTKQKIANFHGRVTDEKSTQYLQLETCITGTVSITLVVNKAFNDY